eukprot:scaffold8260_cov112-Skeletonema_dohrnii-CCMP3373.AAC.9
MGKKIVKSGREAFRSLDFVLFRRTKIFVHIEGYTVEASVAQLCCDFGQQRMKERKGGSPSLLRRNRPFLRVLFRRTEIFLTKAAQ